MSIIVDLCDEIGHFGFWEVAAGVGHQHAGHRRHSRHDVVSLLDFSSTKSQIMLQTGLTIAHVLPLKTLTLDLSLV